MRNQLTEFQIELLDFVKNEIAQGLTLGQSFKNFAKHASLSDALVHKNWYTEDGGIVRKVFTSEGGKIKRGGHNKKHSTEKLNQAVELKKNHTFKEVKEITGITTTTLVNHMNETKEKNSLVETESIQEVTNTSELSQKKKKSGVKASAVMKAIENMKYDLESTIENMRSEVTKEISTNNAYIRGELRGLMNVIELKEKRELENQRNVVSVNSRGEVKLVESGAQTKYDEDKVNSLIQYVEVLEKSNANLERNNITLVKTEKTYDELKRELNDQLNEVKSKLSKAESDLSAKESEIEALKNRSMMKRLFNIKLEAVN